MLSIDGTVWLATPGTALKYLISIHELTGFVILEVQE